MHTIGDDFNFRNASRKYRYLDKIIDYINKHNFGIKL